MVEWFPDNTIFDISAGIILVAFPVVVILAAVVWRARTGVPLANRLALFLLFHTIYHITWLDDIIAISSTTNSALNRVNMAATAMDASVYLAFVAPALGWRIATRRWFIPALIIFPAPFIISILAIGISWWGSAWGTALQVVHVTVLTWGFVYSVTRWIRSEGNQRMQYGLYALALGSKEVPFILQNLARLVYDATDARAWLTTQQILAGIVGHFGILLMALVLAYAILRHHLFDLNLRLRWTISKGTVASVFIATFFVVSEMVSGLLSERLGITVGVLATGMLVFALAPLQRMGEQIAARAVPDTRRPDEMSLDERKAFYREELEIAFLDGVLTKKELVMLNTLQERLSLTPDDVASLHRDIGA